MRNINILINEDHSVSFENDYAGLNKENLQGNIIFKFKNFVDGQARAEILTDDEKGYILLEKVGETYTMPIKSSLLSTDLIIMQLVIDEPSQDEEYPVWKSETFTLKVGYSINATSQIPDDYPGWIEILDEMKSEVENAIEQAENINIESEQLSDGVKVITTNKYGEETTTIVPQGPQGEPGVPGAVKFVIVNELPTEDIQTDTIYLVPSDDPTTQDLYLEYMYINNAWELLGQKQIVVDLTDYVKFSDYAGVSKSGTIKIFDTYGTNITTGGRLYAVSKDYATYTSGDSLMFISKGTLENVITGKGLITNTDYAGSGVSGVIVASGSYGVQVNQTNGVMTATTKSYTDYTNGYSNMFISKGTLENVLTATIGDIGTILDGINNEVL